jgi:hypothetical protein
MELAVTTTTTVQKSRDREGKKKVNQYIMLNNIGEGAFGVVQLAQVQNKFYVRQK